MSLITISDDGYLILRKADASRMTLEGIVLDSLAESQITRRKLLGQGTLVRLEEEHVLLFQEAETDSLGCGKVFMPRETIGEWMDVASEQCAKAMTENPRLKPGESLRAALSRSRARLQESKLLVEEDAE